MPDNAIVPYDKPLSIPVKCVADMKALLLSRQRELCGFLQQHVGLNWENILSAALEAALHTPALLKCTGFSIIGAVKQACEYGLPLSKQLGEAFLIPRWNKKTQTYECSLQIGYKGWMRLIRRAAGAKVMEAEVVYEGEPFLAEKGSNARIEHRIDPALRTGDDKIVAAYSIAYFEDDLIQFVVRTRDEIETARQCSQCPDFGAWKEHYPAMAKKTAILHHANYLPRQLQLPPERLAILDNALDHENQTGVATAEPLELSPEDRAARLFEALDSK
jgi:recombination protein RecT